MSDQRKQSVLSRLEKGKKGLNFVSEFEISKQQVSNILKN